MYRRPVISLISILFIVFLSAGVSSGAEVKIGLIPEQNVFKQKARFKPLGEYLQKKTGLVVNFTILSRYGNIIDRFTEEKLDGAFFGSFTGALAIRKLGIEPLARPVNIDNTSTYWGYIFVRKDSGIKDVAGMKGKRFAFVDKATTAGYIFPVAYLKEHGASNLDTYFKEYFFAGSHDAAINAVLEKKADIGAAKHSVYDRVARTDPRVKNELRIIAQSTQVPSNGLGVRKDLDESVKKKLREALISMDRDPEGKEVLKKFDAVRFIETTVQDYNPVFEFSKKAGIDLKTYSYINK